MNILYIAPIVPFPLIDGNRQRAFHLLKALAREHQVHLLCFVRSQEDKRALEALHDHCASVHGVVIKRWQIILNCVFGWWSKKPLNIMAFKHRGMQKKVNRLIRQYNIQAVHAYRLRMAQFMLKTQGIYRVLDYTDSMLRYFINRKKKNRSLLKWFYINHEIKRLKKYEGSMADSLDASIISSPEDLQKVYDYCHSPWIEVISNGVDTDHYQMTRQPDSRPVVLFVANMHYVPNAEGLKWFCNHGWPGLVKQYPGAVLKIVGRPPKGTVDRRHPQFPGAEFAGIVDDLKTAFESATVAICPVFIASGRQFKVIEYFAAGLPTVTTSLVAKNLEAVHGKHVLIGDDPETFTTQVMTLLRDHGMAKRISEAARQLAVDQYDWQGIGKKLNLIYHKLEAVTSVDDGRASGLVEDRIKSRKILRTKRGA